MEREISRPRREILLKTESPDNEGLYKKMKRLNVE
jgi:hypothetical protein